MFAWLRGRKPKDARFIFLVGAMKCGTTSLAGALGRHPAIVRGKRKEVDYFVTVEPKVESASAYMANWPRIISKNCYLLDASPGYSKFPFFGPSAAAIAAATTAPKIIYIMRDPIKRIESHLVHSVTSSADNLAQYLAKKDTFGYYKYHIGVSSYAMQLAQYTAHFPRCDILPLVFEDVFAKPNAALNKIWAFLDLPVPDDPIALGKRNVGQLLPEVICQPILPQVIREKAVELLRPDMEVLKEDWGVNITQWGF